MALLRASEIELDVNSTFDKSCQIIVAYQNITEKLHCILIQKGSRRNIHRFLTEKLEFLQVGCSKVHIFYCKTYLSVITLSNEHIFQEEGKKEWKYIAQTKKHE